MSTQAKRIIIYLADSKRNISLYLTSTNKSTFKINTYIYKYRFKTGSQIALFQQIYKFKVFTSMEWVVQMFVRKLNLLSMKVL